MAPVSANVTVPCAPCVTAVTLIPLPVSLVKTSIGTPGLFFGTLAVSGFATGFVTVGAATSTDTSAWAVTPFASVIV